MQFYNGKVGYDVEGWCLGVILKDRNDQIIAKIGSWEYLENLREVKSFSIEEGERLVGLKFGRRGFKSASNFDVQLVIGRKTN